MTPPFPRDRHGRWKVQRPEWEAIAAELDAVELALLVAEAEREAILAEAAADVNVPDARRPLTPAEITSGVRFGPIDRRITETADQITAATDALAEHITRTVHDTTATAPTIEDARRTVAGWASPIAATVMPGLAEHAHAAVDEIRPHLERAWTEGAGDVLGEAAHQGITPRVTPALDAATLATITAAATAVVTQRATRLLTVANTTLATVAPTPGSPIAPTAQAAAQVRDALRSTPVAGTTDAARQAVHQAQTSARTTTVRGMIAAGHVPASFHATEQLDENTCAACAGVDGTQYATLDGVLADYREDGGCRWCAGGLRCRGFYVTVWDSETPATVQTPGDRRPSGGRNVPRSAPDVPPRAPSAPVPPPTVPPAGRPVTPPPPAVPPPAPDPQFGPRRRWVDDPDPADGIRRDLDAVFTDATAHTDLSVTSSVAPDRAGRYQVTILGTDPRGVIRLRAVRTVDVRGAAVHHDWFTLAPAYQGTGVSKRVLDASFDLFRANGIRSVHVHANIDVGGYTWASAGFDWDMGHYLSMTSLRDEARRLLTRIEDAATLPGEFADIAAMRDQVAAAGDVAAMPTPLDLASIGKAPGRAHWAGRGGMLGSHWFGVMHL